MRKSSDGNRRFFHSATDKPFKFIYKYRRIIGKEKRTARLPYGYRVRIRRVRIQTITTFVRLQRLVCVSQLSSLSVHSSVVVTFRFFFSVIRCQSDRPSFVSTSTRPRRRHSKYSPSASNLVARDNRRPSAVSAAGVFVYSTRLRSRTKWRSKD